MGNKIENPTIGEPPEPKVEDTQAKVIEPSEMDALLKKMEKAGITNTQELDKKLVASKEAGQLANMVGEYRREQAEKDKRIADLEQAMRMPPADSNYDYDEGQQVDIVSEVRKAIKAEREDERKAAFQAQQEVVKIWKGIQNHKKYNLVKDKWEKKVKDPSFMMEIQTGQKNVVTEFNDMVQTEQDDMLRQFASTIKTLQQGSVPAAPHVEGEAQLPGVKTPPTGNETIKKLTEKVNHGGKLTIDDELAGLDELMRSPSET